MSELGGFVEAAARKFGIPGVAVGVWVDGREVHASHGVTSLENPLPVDERTLFTLGSVTKTLTASTLMRLVADGLVDLDAPVRRYVPELELKGDGTEDITVLNLLNHTAGLDWGILVDTGTGDDALAAYVAKMADLEQIAPPGTRSSYSQAGYNLAGRIIEKVTGLTYEAAVSSILLEPLGMTQSFYGTADVLTRRFAVGHNVVEDGTLAIARPWTGNRANNPGGGIASSVTDQLRWARFQLGDGRAEDGTEVLPAAIMQQMKEQTVALRASTLGDGIGIGWFLRDVDGVRTVGHGGSAFGQFAELLLVPERNFAVVVMSNANPHGIACNQAIVRWALEHYLGVIDRDPEPLPYAEAQADEIAGTYEIDAMTFEIGTNENSLTLDIRIRPELRAASDTEMPPDHPPAEFGLLPGATDEYIVTTGSLKGQRGYFSRDSAGKVVGVDMAGRLFTRVPTTVA